jgi:hypothetical protein
VTINKDRITTAIGAVVAACVAVVGVFDIQVSTEATSVISAVLIAAFGYFTNKQ